MGPMPRRLGTVNSQSWVRLGPALCHQTRRAFAASLPAAGTLLVRGKQQAEWVEAVMAPEVSRKGQYPSKGAVGAFLRFEKQTKQNPASCPSVGAGQLAAWLH